MSRLHVFGTLILGLFLSHAALANNFTHNYYGEEFYQELGQGLQGEDLENMLVTILRSNHILREGQMDLIVENCKGDGKCYRHISVGYNRARVFILGGFYLINNGGRYAVRDVYCEKEYTNGVGPNQLPDNSIINVEHTWPQSKFNHRFDKDMQKSDLHHLFPTDSRMNASRGNFPFGEVEQDQSRLNCNTGRLGRTHEGMNPAFEPPEAHKGNVARALFYFALKYDMKIDSVQEKYLRMWHEQDPVSEEEFDRNDEIYRLQGSRNPFIDHPELAGLIQDF